MQTVIDNLISMSSLSRRLLKKGENHDRSYFGHFFKNTIVHRLWKTQLQASVNTTFIVGSRPG